MSNKVDRDALSKMTAAERTQYVITYLGGKWGEYLHDAAERVVTERDAALARAEKAEAERDSFKARLNATTRCWAKASRERAGFRKRTAVLATTFNTEANRLAEEMTALKERTSKAEAALREYWLRDARAQVEKDLAEKKGK